MIFSVRLLQPCLGEMVLSWGCGALCLWVLSLEWDGHLTIHPMSILLEAFEDADSLE